MKYIQLQGGAKKTPTDIHPHKMARNCLDVGIIGLDLEWVIFLQKSPVPGLPESFRPDNAMLSENVRFLKWQKLTSVFFSVSVIRIFNGLKLCFNRSVMPQKL